MSRLPPREDGAVDEGRQREKLASAATYPGDVAGADCQCFTGPRNYSWNNSCGDTPALWDGRTFEDKATYDPNPPEGAVLRRAGDKLMPQFPGSRWPSLRQGGGTNGEP